jgi:hypothetical protein
MLLIPTDTKAAPDLAKVIIEGQYEFVSREIPRPTLEMATLSQLRLLRNMVFAKYGHAFKSKDLTKHFSRFGWYRPGSGTVKLNSIESANVKLIRTLEVERKAQPFRKLGNGTLVDYRTGLLWEMCPHKSEPKGENCVGPAAKKSWGSNPCQDIESLAGRSDWRAASPEEFKELVDNPKDRIQYTKVFPGSRNTFWTSEGNYACASESCSGFGVKVEMPEAKFTQINLFDDTPEKDKLRLPSRCVSGKAFELPKKDVPILAGPFSGVCKGGRDGWNALVRLLDLRFMRHGKRLVAEADLRLSALRARARLEGSYLGTSFTLSGEMVETEGRGKRWKIKMIVKITPPGKASGKFMEVHSSGTLDKICKFNFAK